MANIEKDFILDDGDDEFLIQHMDNDSRSNLTRKRFIEVEGEETINFVKKMRNENTVRKTACDLRLFCKFLTVINEQRYDAIVDIPAPELNILIARFFMAARKAYVSEYEPDSLKCIQSSIQRHIGEAGSNLNILTDTEFKHSREVLSAKRRDLKAKGLGNKKNKAEPYTEEEIGRLWDKGLLGVENGDALINTMWFNMTTHFILRGRQEHVSMLWGDVELKQTSNGEEYLEFNERATKTRQGSTSSRKFLPKMFAIPDSLRCPVKIYKEFRNRRPEECLKLDARFYLQVNRTPNPKNSAIWFKNQPMGKDKIGNISKAMANAAGITGKKTNHGARRTSLVKLSYADVAPSNIVQLSGHRNMMSLNEYSELSLNQQRELSHMITGLQTSTSSESTDAVTTCHTSAQRIATVSESVTALPIRVSDSSSEVDLFGGQQLPINISFSGANINNINIYCQPKKSSEE